MSHQSIPTEKSQKSRKSRKSQNARKTALVAGATGYLGQFVVRALHRDGWHVRALVRDPERLGDVRELCDEICVAQATEEETLKGICNGVDAVFSSIGVRHFKRRPTYDNVDFQANVNIVDEAIASSVGRFVFVSLLDGDRHRKISPLVDARERVVDRLKTSAMDVVVLRPTGFFNDMGDFFQMAKRGKVWLIGSGETKINPIHGADLADLAVDAMNAPQPQPDIPAGGPEVFTQKEIAELAFQVLGKTPRYGKVSPGTIRFVARLVRPFNKNASALAMMFSALGDHDGVGQSYGSRRLEDHFRSLLAQP